MKSQRDNWSRREFLRGVSLAGSSVILGLRPDVSAGEPPPVDPRALRHPLGEPRVPLEVEIRDFARAREVVEHAAGHARRDPARSVPRLVEMPLPLTAEAAAELLVAAVEARYHSSRFVSTISPSA